MAEIDIKTDLSEVSVLTTDLLLVEREGAGLRKVEAGTMVAVDMPASNVTYQSGDAPLYRRGDAIVSLPYVAYEARMEVSASSGTTRTLATTDDRKFVKMTGASAVLTIPTQASVAFPDGFVCRGVLQPGGTVQAAAGVLLNGTNGAGIAIGAGTAGQQFWLVRWSSNDWSCFITGQALSAADIEALLQSRSAVQQRANLAALQGLYRASGLTWAAGSFVVTNATTGEVSLVAGTDEVAATSTDLIAGTSQTAAVYPKAFGDAGAPVSVSSSSGAITLDFASTVVRTTTLSENITAITVSNLSESVRGVWEVTAGGTGYAITFPTGGTWWSPVSSIAVAANRKVIFSITKRGSAYLLTYSDALAVIA